MMKQFGSQFFRFPRSLREEKKQRCWNWWVFHDHFHLPPLSDIECKFACHKALSCTPHENSLKFTIFRVFKGLQLFTIPVRPSSERAKILPITELLCASLLMYTKAISFSLLAFESNWNYVLLWGTQQSRLLCETNWDDSLGASKKSSPHLRLPLRPKLEWGWG